MAVNLPIKTYGLVASNLKEKKNVVNKSKHSSNWRNENMPYCSTRVSAENTKTHSQNLWPKSRHPSKQKLPDGKIRQIIVSELFSVKLSKNCRLGICKI